MDLDGTVYRGADPVPGAREAVEGWLSQGRDVVYLTNNSAATPSKVSSKLQGMGIPCEPDWVVGTGGAAAKLLASEGCRSVFVVGEPELVRTCEAAGLEVDDRPDPDAVLVGICRGLTYAWIDSALQRLLSGARFVATNRDATYPLEGGRVQPGSGAVVAAIATAAGREPEVVGKPNPLMVRQILAERGLTPSEALVVGDRLDTDIACGLAAGCDVALVLTGVEREPAPGVRSVGCLPDLL